MRAIRQLLSRPAGRLPARSGRRAAGPGADRARPPRPAPRHARRVANRAFRTQLVELEALLPAVAAAALDAARMVACARADAHAAGLRAAHARHNADLSARRRAHEAALKPALSNPNRRAELEALEDAEAARLTAATFAASELQAALLGGETEHAASLVRTLGRATAVLAGILDQFVLPPDLVPPEEPPEAQRKPLRAKLTEELMEQAADADADAAPALAPGRKFARAAWQPLPAGELTPEAAGVGGVAPAEPAAPAPAEELRTLATPAHRATFASRDRVYAAARARYVETAARMVGECQAHLREEEAWSRNWAKMTGMLKGAAEPE